MWLPLWKDEQIEMAARATPRPGRLQVSHTHSLHSVRYKQGMCRVCTPQVHDCTCAMPHTQTHTYDCHRRRLEAHLCLQRTQQHPNRLHRDPQGWHTCILCRHRFPTLHWVICHVPVLLLAAALTTTACCVPRSWTAARTGTPLVLIHPAQHRQHTTGNTPRGEHMCGVWDVAMGMTSCACCCRCYATGCRDV
jgi:hypothetical protein